MRYPKVTTSHIDRLKAEYDLAEKREDFWSYRKAINPGMKEGWFQERLASELQEFYRAFDAGERPRLLVSTPPQHGKSLSAIDFLSWVAGKKPDCRSFFTSYSDRLGTRANLRLQRHFDSTTYKGIFPDTRIASAPREGIRTREMLEYIGHEGYFRNTTTGGPITGESLDLSVVDDPVKSREEANSPTMRDKLWAWFTDDLFTRFSEDSALLLIMTRWHVDDIAGRLIDADQGFKVVSFPAIAEVDDPDGHRKAGEALFPAHKSLEFLNERKSIMISTSWEALYQGSPRVQEGDMIKAEKIEIVTAVRGTIKETVRYWDKAGTDGGGAFTAGVLMHRMTNGKYVIADLIRGQWSAGRREETLKQTATVDGEGVRIWIEQEPGSGGKESAENTVINLAGHIIHVERVTGSKEVRAEPFAAQVENGNVQILQAAWTKGFIDEARLFPNGKYKDQIDAAGGAFNKLTVGVRTDGIIDFYKDEVEALRERQKNGTR
jgi:predicted phage terminase large subunit-like protein